MLLYGVSWIRDVVGGVCTGDGAGSSGTEENPEYRCAEDEAAVGHGNFLEIHHVRASCNKKVVLIPLP
jgi:hypothetical protein